VLYLLVTCEKFKTVLLTVFIILAIKNTDCITQQACSLSYVLCVLLSAQYVLLFRHSPSFSIAKRIDSRFPSFVTLLLLLFGRLNGAAMGDPQSQETPAVLLVGHQGMTLDQLRTRARKHVDEVRMLLTSCEHRNKLACLLSRRYSIHTVLSHGYAIHIITTQASKTIPIEKKEAYLEAVEKAPHLFETDSDPLKFVRRCDYNIWAAAEHLCLYWKERKELFEERAFLPLLVTGKGALTKDDIMSLQAGWPLLLPSTTSGQRVLFGDRR
jgi:hypothetical protein